MRSLIAAVVLSACFTFAFACSPKCKVSSQCESGEHCNFVTGECIQGCTSNADCDSLSICDVMIGVCRIEDIGRYDSGVPTSTTSTTADASVGD